LWRCFVKVPLAILLRVSTTTCDRFCLRRACCESPECRWNGKCSGCLLGTLAKSVPENGGDAEMSFSSPGGNPHSRRDASFPARMAVLPILFYQRCLSPFLGTNCRFYPTCSQYMLEAILRFGVLRGTGLGVKRLLRCGPWNPGGVDPVPEKIRGVKTREDEKRKKQLFGGGERR